MKIAVVHNAVGGSASPDEKDVLVQAEVVVEALSQLGHETRCMACGLDLSDVMESLFRFGPDLVFNLVESLGGHGRLIHLFPALLDAMGLPYTGSGAVSVMVTSNKILAKERMAAAGLPTPSWVGPFPADFPSAVRRSGPEDASGSEDWIVKSVWEHASIGLEESGILRGIDGPRVLELLPGRADELGGSCFAERFVEGREFNISLLAGGAGPRVLPPAEIVFDGFGADRARIVGYRAKWVEDSFEFRHTPRRFDFPSGDRRLLSRLGETALRCWDVFALRGYARVDFRIDSQGRPWILEINTNPCLDPAAGFAAAAERAGIPLRSAVDRIVRHAGVSVTRAALER